MKPEQGKSWSCFWTKHSILTTSGHQRFNLGLSKIYRDWQKWLFTLWGLRELCWCLQETAVPEYEKLPWKYKWWGSALGRQSRGGRKQDSQHGSRPHGVWIYGNSHEALPIIHEKEKPGAGFSIDRFGWVLFMTILCASLIIDSQ